MTFNERLIEILHKYLWEVREGTDKSDRIYIKEIKELFEENAK